MNDEKLHGNVNFLDQSKKIKEHSKSFLENLFPIIGNRNELHLEKIEDAPNKSTKFSDELRVKDAGATFGDKLKISVALKDKEGNILDRKLMSAMTIPIGTKRGSYIVNGNEYQVQNQLRIDPAVYTYKDGSGEIQSQFNLGKGKNFKINIDPRSKVFKMRIDSTSADLFPLLKTLGAMDEDLIKAWGREIFEANQKNSDPSSINKIYKKFVGKDDKGSAVISSLKEYFSKTTMNGSTNQITLGQNLDKVSVPALIAATKKNLNVGYGKEEADERDNLQFQTMHTADDLVKHRLEYSLPHLKRQIKFKVDSKDNIGSMINHDTINKPLESFFTQTELSSTTEQINPLHSYMNTNKITRLGEGGISDLQQVTRAARGVHPSQLGFIDPYQTSESNKIGIATDLSLGASKREDGRLSTRIYNLKTGKFEKLTPLEISRHIISFPDQFDENKKPLFKEVQASFNGKPMVVPASKVEYVFESDLNIFSLGTSLIPFQNSTQGNRKMMAAKQMAQYQMLKHREAPLVQIKNSSKNESLEKSLGKQLSTTAESDGEVISIDDDYITVKDNDGNKIQHPIYKDFYMNEKSYMNSFPLVSVGDQVKKGQTIADTNTTKDGVLAAGVNLRVAYTPYKGKNFEDGVVISESTAKRMTSLHMHKKEVTPEENSVFSKRKFLAFFPTAFTKTQLDKVDDNGMAIVGKVLDYGDPIVLHMRKKVLRPEDIILGSVSKKFDTPYVDDSEVWKYKFQGEVTRTVDGKTKVVRIKTEEPMVIGDKIAGRHGNKGIITEIVPDEEMLKDKEGNPVDIVLNPQGVIGRINPSQLLENALGKVAKFRGKPYEVKNYHADGANQEYVLNKLKKYGLKEKEELFDPQDGNKSIGDINVGYQTILKLDHPVRKKINERGLGPTYTSEMAPGRGPGGGQSVGQMEIYALLAHGAKENLKEMSTIKSDKNDEFWSAFQNGQAYNMPKRIPFVTQKLFDHMKVLGVNPEVQGQYLNLNPISDAEIEHNSGGEVKNGRILKSKNLEAIAEKDGLFDPKIFGGSGVDGKKWGHINLTKKIPNPIYENAIKGVLGLTGPEFEGILKGTHYVQNGKIISEKKSADQMLTGPEAIEALLNQIDVEKDYENIKKQIEGVKSISARDKLFKKLKYLRGLKRAGKGTDIYMMGKVGVLPPQMRPAIPLPDGNLVISDMNLAYKDLVDVNNSLKDDLEIGLGDDKRLTFDLYRAAKATQGVGAPISYGKEFNGVVDMIKGARNKTGFFQGKVVKRKQEMSGRSTVIPNPTLGMDQVGIPEKMAWEIFKPHLKREMSMYYSNLDAKKHIDEKTPTAKGFLESVSKNKFVILNRAPSLHKGSIMAFRPVIVGGEAIQTPNLINAPFNLDHDGDTMAVHVPVGHAAIKEAENMLPSNMLFNPRDKALFFVPSQDAVLGLYGMTKDGGAKTGLKFSSVAEAETAKEKGQIKNWNDVVEIHGIKAALGRHIINEPIPKNLRDYGITFGKKEIQKKLMEIAKESASAYANVIDTMKNYGFKSSTQQGNTITVNDFSAFIPTKKKIIEKLNDDMKKVDSSSLASKDVKIEAKVDLMSNAISDIEKKQMEYLKSVPDNNVYNILVSGSRGNASQVRQVMSTPLMMKDFNDKPLTTPMQRGYIEGQSLMEAFYSAQSARSGNIDKVSGVSEPGMYAKLLNAVNMRTVITEDDCGSMDGRLYDYDKALDRYLAKDMAGYGKRNDVVTDAMASKAKKDSDKLFVRTQFTCKAKKGICAMCYGLDESGKKVEIGKNVGITDAHSMAEPLTQMSMRTFHTGGLAKKQTVRESGFDRIKQLYSVPENLPGRAILAEEDGVVEKITKSPAGGLDIIISGKEYYSASPDAIVKVRDKVKKGQQITEGYLKPQDVLSINGLEEAQNYLTSEMDKTMKDSGIHSSPRIFETLVNNQTSLVKVNSSDHPDIAPGDITKRNFVMDAINSGHKIQFDNMIKGVERVPMEDTMDSNLFQDMNFREIEKSLRKNITEGHKTHIQNTVAPIAAYVMGNFGKDEYGNTNKLY